MEIRDEMTKFRYNLNRFQNSMTEYEAILGMANHLRAKRRTDEAGGVNPVKWDVFITEKDKQADAKLGEAQESYEAMKELFNPKARLKTKAKAKSK